MLCGTLLERARVRLTGEVGAGLHHRQRSASAARCSGSGSRGTRNPSVAGSVLQAGAKRRARVREQQRHRPRQQRRERGALVVIQLGQRVSSAGSSAKNMTAAGRAAGRPLSAYRRLRRTLVLRVAADPVDGVRGEHGDAARGHALLAGAARPAR